MNEKLLRQVQAMILRYPENFDINSWTNGSVIADKGIAPECETTACIAGWALAIEWGAHDDFGRSMAFTFINAAKVLGLTQSQRMKARLFYREKWPEPFRTDYVTAGTRAEEAQVAADRIEHFIATGGAE